MADTKAQTDTKNPQAATGQAGSSAVADTPNTEAVNETANATPPQSPIEGEKPQPDPAKKPEVSPEQESKQASDPAISTEPAPEKATSTRPKPPTKSAKKAKLEKEPKSSHTSKKTEDLISEIQEVAQDLQELSIPVEDSEQPESDQPAEPKLEEPKKEAAPVAGEVKPEDKATSEAKTDNSEIIKEPPKETQPEQSSTPVEGSADQSMKTVNPTKETAKEKDVSEEPTIEEVEVKAEPESTTKKSRFAFLSKLTAKFKKKPSQAQIIEKKPVNKRKKLIIKIVVAVGVTLAILLATIASVAGAIYIASKPVVDNGLKAANSGKEAFALLEAQNLPEGAAKLTETKNHLIATSQAFDKLTWTKYLPGLSIYQEDGQAAVNASVAGVEAGEILLAAVIPYADVLGFSGEGTYSGGSVEDRIAQMVETLEKVTPELEKVSEKLVIVQNEFNKIDPNDYPEQFQGKDIRTNIVKAKNLVHDATLALTDARPIVEALPSILGHPEGKKYMVIFQNDGELRATGGFMSAFAILKLDKGRVAPEKSDDIYSLDNKFGRSITPPAIITKYLNEKSWHLRNMNISPDYKESMTTFKEHYDTLKDEFAVDGIIAIDTVVLEELIKITGPIEVAGYGTFDHENDPRCNLPQIVCELEHIVDKPLATIVTNRKTQILGPLMQEIMKQSLGGGKEKLAELMPLMFRLMEEKHVLAYFTDEKAQTAAETFNIAGRIKEFDGDYFHVNNQNFGGAKSNFYITDVIEQEVEVQADGTIKKTVTMTYTHSQPMDNCNLEAGELCLSGIQRNYFKVYVPKGAQLVEGLGSEVEIGTGEDLGKTYFDGFFTLRPESRAKVKLTYTIPAANVVKDGKYRMLIQKQPGTRSALHQLTVNGKTQEVNLNKDTELAIEL